MGAQLKLWDDSEPQKKPGEDTDGCSPAEKTVAEPQAGQAVKRHQQKKGASGGSAPATAGSAPPREPEPPPTYPYPFRIRYAAQVLDLIGFVDGQAYTPQQIRELLVAPNGYVEFRDLEPEFHMHQETNTLIVTIKGSKKGASEPVRPLPQVLIRLVEARFKATFARDGTEDRVLVYQGSGPLLVLVMPHMREARFTSPATCPWR